MKSKIVLSVALVAALALPAVAGDYAEKCTMDTQACLDAMAAKLQKRGWVGLEMDHGENGLYVINRVIDDSPAQHAGFKIGDELVALNGLRFGDESQMEAIKSTYEKEMVPGNKVTYTVARDGHERDLDVTLAKVPDQVLAQWIGGHMLEHASVATAQK